MLKCFKKQNNIIQFQFENTPQEDGFECGETGYRWSNRNRGKKMPWEWERKGLLNDTLWAGRKHLCYIIIQREAIQSYLDKSRVSLYLHYFIGEKYFKVSDFYFFKKLKPSVY